MNVKLSEKASPHLFAMITVLLILATVAFPNRRFGSLDKESKSRALEAAAARELIPTGLTLEPASNSVAVFQGANSSGDAVWWALSSSRLQRLPMGYGGPIQLMIGCSKEGKITGVKILSHQETPTFVNGIQEKWFLSQFKDRSFPASIKPGIDIDGISQATITVEAICNSIQDLLSSFQLKPSKSRPVSFSPLPMLSLLVVCLLSVFRHRIPEILRASLTCLLLGFVTHQFVSIIHFGQAAQAIRGDGGFHLGTLQFFFVALIATLMSPRGYCHFLCPMGALQDILAAFRTKSIPDHPMQESVRIRFSPARPMFWGILVMGISFSPFPLEQAEAFTPIFTGSFTVFSILIVAAALIGSLITKRFYCRTLCLMNCFFSDVELLRTIDRSKEQHE